MNGFRLARRLFKHDQLLAYEIASIYKDHHKYSQSERFDLQEGQIVRLFGRTLTELVSFEIRKEAWAIYRKCRQNEVKEYSFRDRHKAYKASKLLGVKPKTLLETYF